MDPELPRRKIALYVCIPEINVVLIKDTRYIFQNLVIKLIQKKYTRVYNLSKKTQFE